MPVWWWMRQMSLVDNGLEYIFVYSRRNGADLNTIIIIQHHWLLIGPMFYFKFVSSYEPNSILLIGDSHSLAVCVLL